MILLCGLCALCVESVPLARPQTHDRLEMERVREQIERLDGVGLVALLREGPQVAAQRGRVARDVDDDLGPPLRPGAWTTRGPAPVRGGSRITRSPRRRGQPGQGRGHLRPRDAHARPSGAPYVERRVLHGRGAHLQRVHATPRGPRWPGRTARRRRRGRAPPLPRRNSSPTAAASGSTRKRLAWKNDSTWLRKRTPPTVVSTNGSPTQREEPARAPAAAVHAQAGDGAGGLRQRRQGRRLRRIQRRLQRDHQARAVARFRQLDARNTAGPHGTGGQRPRGPVARRAPWRARAGGNAEVHHAVGAVFVRPSRKRPSRSWRWKEARVRQPSSGDATHGNGARPKARRRARATRAARPPSAEAAPRRPAPGRRSRRTSGRPGRATAAGPRRLRAAPRSPRARSRATPPPRARDGGRRAGRAGRTRPGPGGGPGPARGRRPSRRATLDGLARTQRCACGASLHPRSNRLRRGRPCASRSRRESDSWRTCSRTRAGMRLAVGRERGLHLARTGRRGPASPRSSPSAATRAFSCAASHGSRSAGRRVGTPRPAARRPGTAPAHARAGRARSPAPATRPGAPGSRRRRRPPRLRAAARAASARAPPPLRPRSRRGLDLAVAAPGVGVAVEGVGDAAQDDAQRDARRAPLRG